jgi:hypothetical protein
MRGSNRCRLPPAGRAPTAARSCPGNPAATADPRWTASITPVWKSASAFAFAALLATAGARADFAPGDFQPRLAGGTLEIGGAFDLSLAPKVEEALAKGIPLEIVLEVRLYRERPWLWNARIDGWKVRREIRFHALSGQYLVRATEARTETPESYASLANALRALGNLGELKLALAGLPEPGREHLVRVRASLDIEALPAPLRPVAYTSLDWHLDSGWSAWKIEPGTK